MTVEKSAGDRTRIPAPRAALAPSLLREMNQWLLMDTLYRHGPATRRQLAAETGLSLPTVGAGVVGLEEVSLVRSAGRLEPAQGRPSETYEANPGAGSVVAVDIGRDWVRVRVADLGDNQISHSDVRNAATTAAALVDLVVEEVARAGRAIELAPGDATHTVIGSPGVYDRGANRIRYAANLPGWQQSGLADALTDRLGPRLTIENDANLAALGEHTYGAARGVDDFVYVTIGTGLGAGLVLGGQLYRGARGAAGEVAFLPVREGGPTGRPAPARGMLEEAIAADAVVRYAADAGMTGALTSATVFEAARQGERTAVAAVEQVAVRLADAIATILALVDPAVIVVGGGVGQNLDLLEAPMRAALSEVTPMVPEITASELGTEAVLLGAGATGLSRAREHVFRERIEQSAV